MGLTGQEITLPGYFKTAISRKPYVLRFGVAHPRDGEDVAGREGLLTGGRANASTTLAYVSQIQLGKFHRTAERFCVVLLKIDFDAFRVGRISRQAVNSLSIALEQSLMGGRTQIKQNLGVLSWLV